MLYPAPWKEEDKHTTGAHAHTHHAQLCPLSWEAGQVVKWQVPVRWAAGRQPESTLAWGPTSCPGPPRRGALGAVWKGVHVGLLSGVGRAGSCGWLGEVPAHPCTPCLGQCA